MWLFIILYPFEQTRDFVTDLWSHDIKRCCFSIRCVWCTGNKSASLKCAFQSFAATALKKDELQHNSHALVLKSSKIFRVRRRKCTSRRMYEKKKIEQDILILNGSFQYLSTDDWLC